MFVMKIAKLTLKNFRSYADKAFVFDDKLNVLVGANAQGKTNVLEAIFYAVIGKSFRTSKEKDLLKWGESFGSIEGSFFNGFRDVSVKILFDRERKKSVLIDGVAIHKIGELLGRTCAVFFSPNELKLVKESPDERRKFMDIDISQTNKRYFYLLSRYEKILANRNKLLKNSDNIDYVKDTIDIWDRALVQTAKKIAFERAKFVENITPYTEKAQSYLSGGKEKIELKYISGCGVKLDEKFEENMDKLLKKNLEKDFRFGYTTIGVHRDDIDIYLNGVEVKTFGSQGQQRTVALSLKLAELENINAITGEYPILMLDDVFSELDSDRQKRLLKFADRTQTFITCTDEKKINGETFEIVNGEVFKK